MQRLLDFPIRQTFDATLVAYCGHIEELCLYAGEIVSEWNSVVGEGGLGNCMSVMRQTWQKCSFLRRNRGSSVLFGIRTLPLTASIILGGGQLLRNLTLSVLD